MDPNEFIAHAPDLLKGGAALAGALKFTDIVKAMLGPATAEVAERFRDQARLYRFGRQLECLKKAEQMATDAGFTPKAVPIKILFPLLEGASLEEDEDLHTMWAALLANAADPTRPAANFTAMCDILRQLSIEEAKFINAIYASGSTDFLGTHGGYEFGSLGMMYVKAGLSRIPWPLNYGDYKKYGKAETDLLMSRFMATLDNLLRLRLMKTEGGVQFDATRIPKQFSDLKRNIKYEAKYFRSALGDQFFQACCKPIRVAGNVGGVGDDARDPSGSL